MASRLKEALDSGNFVVTSEVAPPKGTNLETLVHHIDLLKDMVDGLNVTDHQSSVMRYPSFGGCLLIKEHGGEPILQMTCRDRNRLALEADLLFASSRGIQNVLCLTGDAVPVGDHKEAAGVFDLDSVQLLRAIRLLESGQDLGGNDLDGARGVLRRRDRHAGGPPAGATTDQVREEGRGRGRVLPDPGDLRPGQLRRFMEFARQYPVKILAGIVLLSSAKMAQYMNNNVPGIFVPQHLIDELANAVAARTPPRAQA